MTGRREHQPSDDGNENGKNADSLVLELTRQIQRLHSLSMRGVLALALFLVVSIWAWRGFFFLPPPETVTAVLGRPPSARMISLALLLYTFFATVLALARMTSGIEHRNSFSHVGYLTAFYLFYYFGKTLEDNYWAVFCSGITVLGVESYRIRSYCTEGIARMREDIEYISRTGRPPPQE